MAGGGQLVALAALLLVACGGGLGAAAPPHPPELQRQPRGGPGRLRALKQQLAYAEAALMGRDSSQLDVRGAMAALLHVQDAVAEHVAITTTTSSDTSSSGSSAVMRGRTSLSSPDGGGAQAARMRGREAAAAALWRTLGRSGFMLAALSASGLFTEFLPQPPTDITPDMALLCNGSAAAPPPRSGRGGWTETQHSSRSRWRWMKSKQGGSSSSDDASAANDCSLASSAPRVLQELVWLSTAAAAGNVEAQMSLADRFLMGRGGVAASCPIAVTWLQQAAATVLHMAERAGNWEAVPAFIRLRERAMDAASPQSYSDWDDALVAGDLEAAAAMGSDAYAMRRLGYRRLLGKGVPADPDAAYMLFGRAALAGDDGYALFNMGLMHLKGWGAPHQPMKAMTLFRSALKVGMGAAANGLGVIAYNNAGSAADYRAAARWFERGANMSDPDATYNLGTLHLHGLGVKRDANLALSYYGTAFDLGHWKGGWALAQVYARGEPGVERSPEYAEKYLWQFLSQRSSWLATAQAALADYDSPSTSQHHDSSSSSDADDASSSDSDSSEETHEGGGLMEATYAGSPTPPLIAASPRRHVQSLVRHLLLAESGCEAAAENAAWMLLHGQGGGGPRAVGLAANLLYRSALLNHTSSMVELAQLLLNESIALEPQQLAAAAAAQPLAPGSSSSSSSSLGLGGDIPQQQQPATAATGTAAAPSPAAQPVGGGSEAASQEDAAASPADAAAGVAAVQSLSGPVQPLHEVLLSQPHAFLPPVRGPTACTGIHRQQLQPLVARVAAAAAAPVGASPAAAAAALAAARSRRAAVAWLGEAASMSDVEALATLAWLFHEGAVLQGNDTQQQSAAFLQRALATDSHVPTCVLSAMSAVMWLERVGGALLGPAAVAWVKTQLLALRDAVVVQAGLHPVVLSLPDGLLLPAAAAQRQQQGHGGGRRSSSSLPPGESPSLWRKVQRLIQSVGIDPDSLILTCLLGALAGVLWVRQRRAQAWPPPPGVGAGVVGGPAAHAQRVGAVVVGGPAAHAQQQQQQQQEEQEQEQQAGAATVGPVGAAAAAAAPASPSGLRQRRRANGEPAALDGGGGVAAAAADGGAETQREGPQ